MPGAIAACNLSQYANASRPVKNGPAGMVHFDAHTDTWDGYFGGFKYTHGMPFRRVVEEGLLDPKRTVQIGIRGALYNDAEDA